MEVFIPDEENINDGIFKWLNALHLAYNQRVAMRTGLVHQGIVSLDGFGTLDLTAMMDRIAASAGCHKTDGCKWLDDFSMRMISDQLNANKFQVIAKNKPRVIDMRNTN